MGKKQQKQKVLYYELIGLAMLTAGALALGQLGLVGKYLDIAFIYMAGSWSFLVPIFIGYAAIYMMIRRAPFPWTTRHMGLLILFMTWLTAMEYYLFQYAHQQNPHESVALFSVTMTAIKDMTDLVLGNPQNPGGAPVGGGGLIGYVFFSVSYHLFSTVGTMLVMVVGVLIGGALVTQQSLVAVIQRGTRWTEGQLGKVWLGSRPYLRLLFKPERSEQRAKAPANEPDMSMPTKRTRKKPELVLDGEVISSAESPHDENVKRPIINDFATRLKPGVDGDVVPTMETVGNQLVMRFQEPKMSSGPKQSTEKPEVTYPVGPPVHDENYQLPPIRMFALPKANRGGFSQKGAQENARKLESTLESFGVQAKVLEINRGPAVTRYEIQPAVGVKVSKIVSLADDMALALAARDIRIEAPVPGKPVVGIEVPNEEVSMVSLREVLEAPDFASGDGKLTIALGRDISGTAVIGNLQKMPHLLVAGATGSGKSVCINAIIASILVKAKPHEVKFLMVDPKMVELTQYNGIPHLLAPVVTDPRKAAWALKKVIQEMESRYQSFADRGARDIERYNQMLRSDGLDALPYIVVIVDELADLMMVAPGDVEDAICRIAQMARAAGIHLILATQRPSVDVITGVIKANIPSRIAFAVSAMTDSRTILDTGGAEKLLGRGDMLYLPSGANKATRVQGVFVSEDEIEQLVEYVKQQQNVVYTVDLNHAAESSESAPDSDVDSLFMDAVDLVVDSKQASVSMLQRRFRIGYSRAARIVDQMELKGLVGPFEGSKPREVLISSEQWAVMKSTLHLNDK